MTIQNIPIDKVRPNPFQPESRVNISEEDAEKFGISILEHGMILTPVGRQVDGTGIYEVGDGWLRLKGHEWLVKNGHNEFQDIRFDIRELTDQQMADLVLEANKIRKDLNPIEEAQFYRIYLEKFKVSQKELATKHNISQGEVANSIRLLDLPDYIQEKVISHEISHTHARQLLRINKAPQIQEAMVKQCVTRNSSVSDLSNSIESNIWHNSKSLNPKADRWDKPVFDVSVCKDCEHNIRGSEPYGSQKKEDRCLKEECWEKKNTEAIQASIKEAEKAIKKKNKKGQKVFTSDNLSHDKRNDLDEYALRQLDNPEECAKCEKKALFKYRINDDGDPREVCIDPACFRKKKTKKTRDTNKLRKEQDRELTIKLGEVFHNVHNNPKNCLLILARRTLPGLSSEGKMDMVTMFALPKLSNGRLDLDALLKSLYEKSLDELLQLTVAATITQSRRSLAYHDYSTELKDELKRDIAILTSTYDSFLRELTEFQEANCRGCRTAIEIKIGTGEECCNFTYNKKIGGDGKCQSRVTRQSEDHQDIEELTDGEADE